LIELRGDVGEASKGFSAILGQRLEGLLVQGFWDPGAQESGLVEWVQFGCSRTTVRVTADCFGPAYELSLYEGAIPEGTPGTIEAIVESGLGCRVVGVTLYWYRASVAAPLWAGEDLYLQEVGVELENGAELYVAASSIGPDGQASLADENVLLVSSAEAKHRGIGPYRSLPAAWTERIGSPRGDDTGRP
jgi:hypothetical protein